MTAANPNTFFQMSWTGTRDTMVQRMDRARAALQGRDYVIPDDVKALATATLRHRLLLSPAAEIEGRQIEDLVATLVEQTEAPR